MAEWVVREIQNLLITSGRRSNPKPSRNFAKSRLVSVFLLALLELLFAVFSLKFAKRSFASM